MVVTQIKLLQYILFDLKVSQVGAFGRLEFEIVFNSARKNKLNIKEKLILDKTNYGVTLKQMNEDT